MAHSQNPSELRNWLNELDPHLSIKLEALWRRSNPIHERQSLPDGNENGPIHVETVERNIWRLLNGVVDRTDDGRAPAKFDMHEVFLLSAAVCCHDFDKGLKSANPLPEGFDHGAGSGEFVVKNAAALGLAIQEAKAIRSALAIHDLKGEKFKGELGKLNRKEFTP